MTGLQGIVDAGANVVHASSRGDVDGERKQALDEALLDNGLFGELGFLIEQGDDDLGQIGGVVARANLVEMLRNVVLVDVTRELFCLGRKSVAGSLDDLQFVGMVIDIEVLYCLGGVGQNLVVSAVNIDGHITHKRLNICLDDGYSIEGLKYAAR